MDATPSNGSGVRARSRKVNTSPASTPNEANGQAKGLKNGRSSTRQRTGSPLRRVMPAKAGPLPPFETYAAIAIEDVQPQLDGGRWPIKRVVGDTIQVSADILKEGHDLLLARVFFQPIGQPSSTEQEAPMRQIENDRWPDRSDATRYRHTLDLIVDRPAARFAAWYEIFPRSQGTDPTRSATFREAEQRLPAIAAMGFDTLYMPPIHPIGTTNRKGPNNSLVAGPNDPGSPYAIGSPAGGHDAIAPELGTLDDFLHFQQTAREHGLELALDFAIQVSPDHPSVDEHPDGFYH